MSAIGENIRSIRREQKLTQLALAMRVGVTPQAVGKWERGESEPDISLLLPIAKALNVTAETLFGLENRRGSAPASFLAEEFPESLKCRRLAANLTQAELARKLDVRPQTVSKWENGACAPDAGYLAALCSLYGSRPPPFSPNGRCPRSARRRPPYLPRPPLRRRNVSKNRGSFPKGRYGQRRSRSFSFWRSASSSFPSPSAAVPPLSRARPHSSPKILHLPAEAPKSPKTPTEARTSPKSPTAARRSPKTPANSLLRRSLIIR